MVCRKVLCLGSALMSLQQHMGQQCCRAAGPKRLNLGTAWASRRARWEGWKLDGSNFCQDDKYFTMVFFSRWVWIWSSMASSHTGSEMQPVDEEDLDNTIQCYFLPVGFFWACAWFQWGILPKGWGYVKTSCLCFVQILCVEGKVGELWGFTLNPMQTLGAIWQMSWTIIYHTRKYALEYLRNAKQKQIYLSQQIKHSPLVYNPKPQSQAI